MIQVYPISPKVKKYCSHCDKPAVFEIWFCNPKIVQQSGAGCLCNKCMKQLKKEIIRATENKEHIKRNIFQPCDYCDGCGWTEGGETLKTTCPQCNGTGKQTITTRCI